MCNRNISDICARTQHRSELTLLSKILFVVVVVTNCKLYSMGRCHHHLLPYLFGLSDPMTMKKAFHVNMYDRMSSNGVVDDRSPMRTVQLLW